MLTSLLEGVTPWSAAQTYHKTDASLSVHRLYEIAREVKQEIEEYLGKGVSQHVEILLATGELRDVPRSMIGDIIREAEAEGFDVTEQINLTARRRNGE